MNDIERKKELLRFKAKVSKALHIPVDQLCILDHSMSLLIVEENRKVSEKYEEQGLWAVRSFRFLTDEIPAFKDMLFRVAHTAEPMFLSIGKFPQCGLIQLSLNEIMTNLFDLIELDDDGIAAYSKELMFFSRKCLTFSKFNSSEGIFFKLLLEGGGWSDYFK